MLNLFRKHAKSWIIKIALFLIVIVFVFWGGYSYQDRERNQIAKVDDHYISFTDFNRAHDQLVEMYRRQLGNAFSADMIRQFNLRQQALDMLIERYVLVKAARELGIAATVQEVQNQILQYPVFQTDGKFDERQYKLLLQQNRLTPEVFEQQLGEDLSLMKVEEFVKRRAVVTDEEILADLRFNYSPIEIAYVVFDPQSMEGEVEVKEEALQAFFKENEEFYKESEKRRMSYVLFRKKDFSQDVQVTEDELRQKYEERKADYYRPPQVQALHILFRVSEGASPEELEQVRSQAGAVLADARQGVDFSALARKHSQDPSVAENGGDLGWFSRDRMVPEFTEAAFALQKGEISDLVRTPFGFHIIKVVDTREEKTETFEEVKQRLEASTREDRAEDIAYRKALDFSDAAYGLQDLAKAAEIQKVTVAGTGVWVTQRDRLPGLDTPTPEVMKQLFSMSEGEVSKVMEIPEGFLVAAVDAVQPPQAPPLDQAREQVSADFKRQQASNLARERAASFIQEVMNAGSLEKAAGERNLEMKKSGLFSRMEPPQELSQLRGPSLDAVFGLEMSSPIAPEPLGMGTRYVAVELLGRKAPETEDQEKRKNIAQRLLEEKRTALWDAWLDQQRKRANIKMLNEV